MAKSYVLQWRSYRLRRSLALFFLYGLLPFCVAAALLLSPVLVAGLVMLLWLGAAGAAIWWSGEFRCPRCWRRFGALGSKKKLEMWSGGLFDEICHNCKLRKFTDEV
ncbi:hypothetical protein [Granulicella sp. WH15]|uniref:hypothetical protein n=1 Tax=Granulicella sp. WH15 TaxID=2602070 RepID=UPI0013A57785|nr:hypothetical protein [Granulicella sp. WH15]